MYKLTSHTELELAHRLITSYAMKCQHLHGHRYEVFITVSADKLNEDNMIVDFKKLKEIIKQELDDKYDHGVILKDDDPLVDAFKNDKHTQRLHIVNENPTCEWMSKYWFYLLNDAFKREGLNIKMYSLKVFETSNNCCEYIED